MKFHISPKEVGPLPPEAAYLLDENFESFAQAQRLIETLKLTEVLEVREGGIDA